MRLDHTTTQCPIAQQGDLQEHLIGGVAEGQYDRRLVELTSMASACAYSNISGFANLLCHAGLDGEIVSIRVRDKANITDTTVYVFQSHDKKLGIVTVRTGDPSEVLNYMTCSTASRKVPFINEGYAHAGLTVNLMAVGTMLKEFLAALYTGESLGKRLTELTPKDPNKRPKSEIENIGKEKAKLQALYIAGHGMGGAVAEMVGAFIHMDPRFAAMRPILRAVHSYGAPRWSDPGLAMSLHEKLGTKTFRFIYQKDIVPRLPSWIYGRYMHFGRRYVSSTPDGVWVMEPKLDRFLMTNWTANYIGTMTYAKEKLLGYRVILPVTWVEHSPMNYVVVSKNSNPDKLP